MAVLDAVPGDPILTRGDEVMSADADVETIKARLMKAVGEPVRFAYLGNKGVQTGRLKDRVVGTGSCVPGVQYYDVVDLIEFDGQSEPWVRITYYRHLPDGRMIFAGQTSICEPISVWTRLRAAARQKDWFPVAADGRSD